MGMPDSHHGREILAGVVLRDGMACSEDELSDFCLQRLGRYKTPKTIRFVTELRAGPRAGGCVSASRQAASASGSCCGGHRFASTVLRCSTGSCRVTLRVLSGAAFKQMRQA